MDTLPETTFQETTVRPPEPPISPEVLVETALREYRDVYAPGLREAARLHELTASHHLRRMLLERLGVEAAPEGSTLRIGPLQLVAHRSDNLWEREEERWQLHAHLLCQVCGKPVTNTLRPSPRDDRDITSTGQLGRLLAEGERSHPGCLGDSPMEPAENLQARVQVALHPDTLDALLAGRAKAGTTAGLSAPDLPRE